MKKIMLSVFLFSFMFFGGIDVISNQDHQINFAEAKGGVIEGQDPKPLVGASGDRIQLKNPLGNNIEDIPTLVEQILEIAMKVGTPLVALMIIYTGYLFIAAQGNPEKLQKAKDSLVWVFIGAAILLGAYVIAKSLVGTINAIRGV